MPRRGSRLRAGPPALDLANVQSILNEPARSAPPRPHPENDGFPRRDYYRVAADLFERSMAQRLARWRRLTEVIVEGRLARTGSDR